ncbi:YcnI family protein [Streptomyces sp. NPDC020490]|uniref:YcnI family protein n=1 Tax=Streptomyces sp. NPDC020490 TaxID=3365078 RepID=UPI0037BDA76D
MRPTRSRAALTALTCVTAGVVLLATAGPVAAHVGIDPRSAEAGSWARLTFRVPDERPDAATTKVEVVLPAGRPLASVSVRPVPGWTVRTEKRHLDQPLVDDGKKTGEAVSRIVWTGGRIGPGEFQEFDVSLGPLPEHGEQMVFKTLQTYDDGEVVRWIEQPAANGTEPEHPAPVLALTPAAGTDADEASATREPSGAASGEAGTDAPNVSAPVAASGGGDSADVTARVLGGAGAAAGLAGLLAAAATRRRAAKRSPGPRGW